MIVHGLLNIVLSTGKNCGNMSLECEWTFNSCGNLAMGCYNWQVMCHIWESMIAFIIVWNNRKKAEIFFPKIILWIFFENILMTNYTNWWYMFYIDTKHLCLKIVGKFCLDLDCRFVYQNFLASCRLHGRQVICFMKFARFKLYLKHARKSNY